MDQDDPEQRIANLEQQLEPLQPVAASGTGSGRSFVAYAIPAARRAYLTFGLVWVLVLVYFGFFAIFLSAAPNIFDTAPYVPPLVALALGVPLCVVCVLAFRRLYWKKVGLFVAADGLTIDSRPGDVFPLQDAQLGQWTGRLQPYGPESVGRALFLTSGSDRFVVGAHRMDSGAPGGAGSMPSDGPQERYARLDARISPQLFDELLAIVGPYRRTTNQ